MNELISIEQAASLIHSGVPLSFAGPESALAQLPAGNWIGGTIPYFMVKGGGVVVNDGKVFATQLAGLGTVSFDQYDAAQVADIARNAPDNGFALAIIPAGSAAHQRFAAEAANTADAFLKPTVGWISGVNLNDLGKVTPKVYFGPTARALEDAIVVAYIGLPADKLASVEIVNLFEQDDGDVITFPATTFETSRCWVNGQERNLAEYLASRGLDNGRLPLVGDFAGAKVNVSIQGVDAKSGRVTFYAPVFSDVEYRFAKPVQDYSGAFRERLGDTDHDGTVFSCNCILNFLFGELEGKAIGGVAGPITFGEIGYQLLNQTLVNLRVV